MIREFPEMLNAKQLGNYLGVSVDTVWDWERTGTLPPRVSKMHWHRRSVDAYLARQTEPPRLLNQKQLCQLLGVSIPILQKMVAAGLLPRRMTGTSYWDRKAVDIYLDRANGVDAKSETPTKGADQPPSADFWLEQLNGKHKNSGSEGVREQG